MQAAWVKYGRSCFVFRLLLRCVAADLAFYEQLVIDGFSGRRYNKRKFVSSNLGIKMGPQSPEHVAKRADARRGKKMTAEQRAQLSIQRSGRKQLNPRSDKHRASLSAALKGRPPSESCKEKAIAANTGRPFSQEHRLKLSRALKLRKLTPEHKAKMSAANIGKTLSAETRLKISIAKTGRPGRKWTEEQRLRQSEKTKGKKSQAKSAARLRYAASLPERINPRVLCACGCGTTFLKFYNLRPRRYVKGHGPKPPKCIKSPVSDRLLASLHARPRHITDIAAGTGISLGVVSVLLPKMRQRGLVVRTGPGLYQLNSNKEMADEG
jgi:hypothetical protein